MVHEQQSTNNMTRRTLLRTAAGIPALLTLPL